MSLYHLDTLRSLKICYINHCSGFLCCNPFVQMRLNDLFATHFSLICSTNNYTPLSSNLFTRHQQLPYFLLALMFLMTIDLGPICLLALYLASITTLKHVFFDIELSG